MSSHPSSTKSKIEIITKETLLALPSNYIPSQSSSHHLHCSFLEPNHYYLHLDHCSSLLTDLLASALPALQYFDKRAARMILLQPKSNQIPSLLRNLQWLSFLWMEKLKLLLCPARPNPLWPHPLFISLSLPLLPHTGLFALPQRYEVHPCLNTLADLSLCLENHSVTSLTSFGSLFKCCLFNEASLDHNSNIFSSQILNSPISFSLLYFFSVVLMPPFHIFYSCFTVFIGFLPHCNIQEGRVLVVCFVHWCVSINQNTTWGMVATQILVNECMSAQITQALVFVFHSFFASPTWLWRQPPWNIG